MDTSIKTWNLYYIIDGIVYTNKVCSRYYRHTRYNTIEFFNEETETEVQIVAEFGTNGLFYIRNYKAEVILEGDNQ